MHGLITGVRGFIGSCLVARATDFGHTIIGLDDCSRGLNNVESISEAKFIKHDCREGIGSILDEYEGLEYQTSTFAHNFGGKPDFVCHLAAGTGSLSRPYEELCELNIDMTKRVYKDAVEHGIKCFVFPTTSLVEGVPDSPYVRSKQDAIDWLISQDDDINLIPLQLYNVTGSYADFSEHRKLEVHIIPIMLEKYMRNEVFIVNGKNYDTPDGSPGRDFSNVVDVCDAILDLVHIQLKEFPFKTNKPIKIGTGMITTTLQMIDMFNNIVEPLFGRKLKFDFGERRAYDCGWLRCDQPYLHLLKNPTMIQESLKDEVETLLRVVYKV